MWLKRTLGILFIVYLFFSISSCQKDIDTGNEINSANISPKSEVHLNVQDKQDSNLLDKDLLIKYQNAQLRDLRLTRFIWILACILILTIAFFVYLVMRRKRDMQRLKYVDQVTRLRMQNIRNQISPHFVLNILNREIISVEESKRNGLYGLAKLLRESLEMTEKSYVSLEKELEFVKTYIQLERGSLDPDFQLEWNIDNRIDQKKVNIPPMIIQIPVENAIKHGLRPQLGHKCLSICIVQETKGLIIKIQDNGVGCFSGEISNKRGSGTGMNVLYQTIQLLNSKNTEKIIFRILTIEKPEQAGAKVEIFIPAVFKFE